MTRLGTQVLTAEDAARYLRLHVKSIHRLVEEGKIPGRKVGGRWRSHRDELERWLRKGSFVDPQTSLFLGSCSLSWILDFFLSGEGQALPIH